MKLSIVIPTLDEQGNLPRALGAVRGLTAAWGGTVETIVVDGGSQDGTVALAEEAGVRVLTSEPGRGRQLRAGCQAATGGAVLLLHADTVPCPAMGEQLAGALADPSIGCGAFRQRIDAPGVLYRWLEKGNAYRASRLRTPYGDQAIFVRSELLERVGGVPDLPLMEDVELMRRLRKHARPVLLDGPLTVSARRWRRRGVVRQTATNWALVLAYRCGVSPERLARWYGREASLDPR
ncbi:Glycosyl transferase family 2 [Planctomycetes bacterium MalM25]|nr:Glycosyl transferase family 2 [Planctomycetes bacterium MalM25]